MIKTATCLEEKVWEGLKDFEKIPELDFSPKSFFHDEYAVAAKEEVLNPLIEKYQVFVFTGSYFGDEGKGKITDAIVKHEDIVMLIRTISGSNAGHTVMFNGRKYTFHVVPSGILAKGVACYIGPECVVDPLEFMRQEISKLKLLSWQEKIDYKEKLFVGNVHIVTPYHKLMDVIRNIKDASNLDKIILGNVSTLKGIAPVHSSKVMKTGPRLDDLFGDEENLKKIIEKDMQAYKGMLFTKGIKEEDLLKICVSLNKDMERVPDYIIGFLEAEDKAQFLINMYRMEVKENNAFPTRKNVIFEIQERLAKGEKIGLEIPQGFFLSNAEQTHWGSGTSPNTKATGGLASSGINIQKYKVVVFNVHKAPIGSRIGGGVNPAGFTYQTYFSDKAIDTLDDLDEKACAKFDEIQKQFWESIGENGILKPTKYTDETGETYLIGEAMAIASAKEYGEHGATTLKPRITCLFDCVAHAHVMREQGPYTVLSAVDRGDILDKVGVIIAYIYHSPDNEEVNSDGRIYKNGDIIRTDEAYPNERVLKNCCPIIKVLDGWKDSPIAADKWDGKTLAREVQMFMETIEHFTGAEIIAIGNGTEDKNMIYIKKIPVTIEEGDMPRPEDL